MRKPNDDKFLEYEINRDYTDEKLKSVISDKVNPEDTVKLPKEERDKITYHIYKSTGVSIRQLSRVMKIGRGIIQKAVKDVPNKMFLR